MQRGSKAARAAAWSHAVVIGFGQLPLVCAASLVSSQTEQSAAETRADLPPAAHRVTEAGALAIEHWVTGSSSLMPLMVADFPISHTDLSSSAAGGPLDGAGFVRQASEISGRELDLARNGVSHLKDPALRRLAGQIVMDHHAANSRLSALAQARGWPIAPRDRLTVINSASDPAPTLTTDDPDFDARWRAEMIAGQERLLALHHGQASSGMDTEIRNYALDTLPVFERQLAELEDLQK